MTEFLNNLKTNQKTAFEAVLEESSLMQISGLSSVLNYSKVINPVNSCSVENKTTVEVRGIEPPDSWMTIPSPNQATPTAFLLYQKLCHLRIF